MQRTSCGSKTECGTQLIHKLLNFQNADGIKTTWRQVVALSTMLLMSDTCCHSYLLGNVSVLRNISIS